MMKVFLVDDSILIRQRLARMLSNVKGVRLVGEALGPREATERISEAKPDVVILDIQLLGGTGMEVLQDLKTKQPSPVVMIVTNYPEYRQKFLEAGADFFFDKSTEFHRIPLLLRKMIEQEQAGQNNRAPQN